MTHTLLFISTQEIFVILIIVVMLFGSKKIPELARGLGKGIRELKDASNEIRQEIKVVHQRSKKRTIFERISINNGLSFTICWNCLIGLWRGAFGEGFEISLALRLQISTLVVGMTVVSFATSAPELLVSLEAAFE